MNFKPSQGHCRIISLDFATGSEPCTWDRRISELECTAQVWHPDHPAMRSSRPPHLSQPPHGRRDQPLRGSGAGLRDASLLGSCSWPMCLWAAGLSETSSASLRPSALEEFQGKCKSSTTLSLCFLVCQVGRYSWPYRDARFFRGWCMEALGGRQALGTAEPWSHRGWPSPFLSQCVWCSSLPLLYHRDANAGSSLSPT